MGQAASAEAEGSCVTRKASSALFPPMGETETELGQGLGPSQLLNSIALCYPLVGLDYKVPAQYIVSEGSRMSSKQHEVI